MSTNEFVAKQTAEMLNLEEMQRNELDEMTKRHDKEYAQNPASPYFAERRLQQRNALLTRHKIERDRLFQLHDTEYKEWRKLRNIIREAGQASYESEPKKEIKPQQEKPPEKETRLQKLKKQWQKMTGKNWEKEM